MKELWSTSARELRDRVHARTLGSRELVDACLARIEAVNPELRAVVALCAERARAEADAADRALSKGEPVGPLHGLPMTLKDSFDTEGVVSTWGTPGRRDFVPERDAVVVRRLREAGAIVLGKTNTPELTLGFHPRNPVYPETRNPYDLAHSPGGSSGGAAAIVAAGGSPFDIGTDTGGSVRNPAHACGIAGLRPTSGRVPRTGHAIGPGGPIEALTQPGPMARRVEDLTMLLPILAGPDPSDPAIAPVPLGDPQGIDLSTLRVAFHVDNGVATPIPEIQDGVRAAADALANAGARVREERPPGLEQTNQVFAPLLLFDGGAWGRRLLERCGTRPEDTSLPIFSAPPFTPDAEQQVRVFEQWDRFRTELLGFMQTCDVIVSPPSALPALALEDVDSVSMDNMTYTMSYNLSGQPGCVVRANTTASGLPVGVMLQTAPWREDVALAAAGHIESALGGFEPPTL